MLPSVLAQMVQGRREVELEALNLAGALDELVRELPALAVHLFNERREFRQHVRCYLNNADARTLQDGATTLADGDRIAILQAVAGGR